MASRDGVSKFTVHISGFQDQDKINPRPNEKTESEYLLEEYLSPSRLRELTSQSDLSQVTSLQMVVDTTENSLGNFGHYLPSLKELDLSNSNLTSVRDMGSSLTNLEVLWMTKCQLVDLDGLSTFCNLTELYLAYNHINNLNDLSMMENLRTLDLEANDLDDIDQILFLEMCRNLQNLCLQHNPVCSSPKPLLPFDPDYNYRSSVIKMLPQLKTLDDLPASNQSQDFTILDEDLQLLTENIKFGLITEGESNEERPGSSAAKRPATASLRPGSAFRPRSAMPSMMYGRSTFGARPGTAAKLDRPPTAAERAFFQIPTHRPGTGSSVASTDSAVDLEEFSKLTSGNIVCGNPLKAIRSRKNEKFAQKHSRMTSRVSDTNAINLATEENFHRIMEELKQWKRDFEGQNSTKVSLRDEVNVLTLSADESFDASAEPETGRRDLEDISEQPTSNSSPEKAKKSSVNIRRRQYVAASDSVTTDSIELNYHDECYEDGDSGLASSRDTDTPASFLNEYQHRGPLRVPGTQPRNSEIPVTSRLAPHQMSIKAPLVPVAMKPNLENLGRNSPVKPKIKNAARPAKSTLEQANRNKPVMMPAPPAPHKMALAARPKSSMSSLTFEKFSTSSSQSPK